MSTGAIHGDLLGSYKVKVAVGKNIAVKIDTATDNQVDLADATTDEPIGITQAVQATIGGLVAVKEFGKSLALAGTGGWTRGDKLTLSTAGVLITTTTAGDKVAAIARDTVSDTEYGEVQIISPAIRYDSF